MRASFPTRASKLRREKQAWKSRWQLKASPTTTSPPHQLQLPHIPHHETNTEKKQHDRVLPHLSHLRLSPLPQPSTIIGLHAIQPLLTFQPDSPHLWIHAARLCSRKNHHGLGALCRPLYRIRSLPGLQFDLGPRTKFGLLSQNGCAPSLENDPAIIRDNTPHRQPSPLKGHPIRDIVDVHPTYSAVFGLPLSVTVGLGLQRISSLLIPLPSHKEQRQTPPYRH